MSRNKLHIILSAGSLVLMTMVSCLSIDEPIQYDKEVKLKASLVSGNIFTKAGTGSLDPTFNQTLTIGMARIDENLTTGYPIFKNTPKQMKAEMKPGVKDLNTRSITFVNDYQQFEDATSKIKYASWYPYSDTSYDETKKTIKTTIDGNTDVMYGDIATGSQKEGFNTIYFNHALCKFTFHVYAMVQEDSNPDNLRRIWGKLKNITIKGLATECQLTLPLNSYTPDSYKVEYLGAAENNMMNVPKTGQYLLEELPVGGANAAAMPALLAAPPADGLLKVLVETENQGIGHQVSTKTMTIARDFKPGRNYDIFLRFSDHGLINTEVIIGDWHEHVGDIDANTNNKTYYDLSATEHANCYIVTSANYSYCFDVTTIGNGDYGSINNETTTIKPGYVDLLWIDKELKDHFELENHIPVQNRALFNVTNTDSDKNPGNKKLSHKGNALIGVWSKDPAQGGVLLWTWHIWVTDYPQDQAYKNGFVALDRDLGAIDDHVNTATDGKNLDGLYYQWGRPTPLPLGRQTVKNDENGTPFSVNDDPEDVHLMSRISHPEKFYTQGAIVANMPTYENLWGYHPENREYRKTIYDPCPAGYRVPSKSMFLHIQYTDFKTNQTHKHSFESTVDTYYLLSNPMSGYWENSSTRKGYDNGCYLWTSSLNKQAQRITDAPLGLSAIKDADGNPQLSQQDPHPLTHALPVRCVSKRSTPEIRDLSAYQTANSYIIDKTGYYKFKATVRGNGVNELVSPGEATSIDITENLPPDIANKAYKVVPLWWQGDFSVQGDVNKDPDEIPIPVELLDDGLLDDQGYVTMYVNNSNKGNLIVAAVDQPGNILWSWHLWLTDTPKIHMSYDYALMDRFLGATSAPSDGSVQMEDDQLHSTFGFYYQWGRKDPFPGPSAISNTAAMSTWWRFDETQPVGQQWTKMSGFYATTNDKAEKTAHNSAVQPMRYHLSTDNNFFENGSTNVIPHSESFQIANFFGAPRNQTYSNANKLESMWGYSALEKFFGKTTSKTMYDPCPPGYSVCYYLIWREASNAKNSQNFYSKLDEGIINATNQVHSLKGGMTLKHTYFDKTWYPYAGYIDCYTGKFVEVGSVGRFYTSTPKENTCRSMGYWPNGGIIETGQCLSNGNHGVPTSFGMPVRCQKN